jgi:hypothetical protein
VHGDQGEEFMEAKEVAEKRKKRRTREEKRTKEAYFKNVLLSPPFLPRPPF